MSARVETGGMSTCDTTLETVNMDAITSNPKLYRTYPCSPMFTVAPGAMSSMMPLSTRLWRTVRPLVAVTYMPAEVEAVYTRDRSLSVMLPLMANRMPAVCTEPDTTEKELADTPLSSDRSHAQFSSAMFSTPGSAVTSDAVMGTSALYGACVTHDIVLVMDHVSPSAVSPPRPPSLYVVSLVAATSPACSRVHASRSSSAAADAVTAVTAAAATRVRRRRGRRETDQAASGEPSAALPAPATRTPPTVGSMATTTAPDRVAATAAASLYVNPAVALAPGGSGTTV